MLFHWENKAFSPSWIFLIILLTFLEILKIPGLLWFSWNFHGNHENALLRTFPTLFILHNSQNHVFHENHEKSVFAKSTKMSKKCDFSRKTHISGPRRKSFHSPRNIDAFGSPKCPKCTLGQKVRFCENDEISWNSWKFHFSWKSWKSSIFEVKIATRNGNLSSAKSTFSLSGAPAARLSGNFAKFHEISWNSMKFAIFCKTSHFSGPGRKSFHSSRNIDGFGAQFRPKVHFGAKSTKYGIFRNVLWISLNFAQFRPIALKKVH